MDIVTVQNLHKTFGKGENAVHALAGIDLSIEKGKFTAIIGASGSGKTTLLNMMGFFWIGSIISIRFFISAPSLPKRLS